MAAPTFQGKTSFVRQFIAAVKAAANAAVDSSKGSFTLAVGQAVAGAALFLQAQIARVLLLTRAATSTGTDLDSFYADFNFFRLPAVKATTTETFARATATQQAVVLVGQLLQTGPGGVQFAVARDTTDPNYNAQLDGYVLAINTASITAPIQAVVAGISGNVLANTITSFVSPIPGVDTCTNASDVTTGLDAESDTAFRARFPLYLASLATADAAAIDNAIQNVQQGLDWVKVANYDYPGNTPDNGNFFVVVDDGSGNPPDSLITAIQKAISAVVAFGIRFTVNKATVVNPAIVITIRVASGYSADAVKAAVSAAILTMENAIPLSAGTLFVSQVEAAALSVPGCQAVQPGTTINAVAADYALTAVQIPRNSACTVNTY